MTHARLIPAIAAAIALAATTTASAQAPAGGPPNIVLIVSDDHGYGDVGYHNREVKTPNLDRLATQGVRLEGFHSYPICSLTRAALLTGLSTLRTGVNNRTGLDLKYRTMADALKGAGYQSSMAGKWHLGGASDNTLKGPDYYPTRRGFDHFYGFLHGAIDYSEHIRKDTGELDWQRDGKPVAEPGFTTDLLVDDAIRRLKERDRSRPAFLYLAFNAVHGPLQSPPSGTDAYRSVADRRRRTLLANVTHMDAAIGRLLAAIDDERISDRTIVLFMGDNGGQLSQGASNAPLRGEKGTVFEGGTRVPAIVRWPGVLPAGTTSRQLLWAADVFPTLCAAAKVDPRNPVPFDGLDLWETLRSGRETPRELLHGTTDLALYRGPWKLIRPREGKPLLFRIIDDPNEANDRAAAEGETVRAMLGRMDELVAAMPRSRPQGPRGEGGDRPRGGQGRKRKGQPAGRDRA
ncbi:MAG: arylsulfatase, partial [Thermoleophilia bacterium]|nr:arylsulfatase [Thermoleophilia bacterium]